MTREGTEVPKFKLNYGTHQGRGPVGPPSPDFPHGEYTKIQYGAGAVIDTDVYDKGVDLMAVYNTDQHKFSRLGAADPLGLPPETVIRPGETPQQFAARIKAWSDSITSQEVDGGAATYQPPPPLVDDTPKDTYEAMTVDELRKHAEAEEVNLGRARTKDEIIRVLRGK